MKKPNFTTCLILRHGRTEWNQDGRLQGQGDSPLLESSVPVIAEIAKHLSGIEVDHFFRSPLGRVTETLQHFQPFAPKCSITDHRLSEISFGLYNGQRLADVPQEVLNERKLDKWNHRWPEGESYADVHARLVPFVNELCELEGTVAIMAHETVNKLLIHLLTGCSKETVFRIKHPNHVVYKVADQQLSCSSVGAGWHQHLAYTGFE